jgi:hypothetical protein
MVAESRCKTGKTCVEVFMKKILITGGPVHDYLDAVKIITNRFKGGRIQELARDLTARGDTEVHYLGSKLVTDGHNQLEELGVRVWTHDGYHNYRQIVRELSAGKDAVILGAAVANLIPLSPWKGKFPSHQYKIGDIINIPFTIAPRVIDEIKRKPYDDSPSNPNCHLFGFKLLKGVKHEELVEAAYEIVLSSGATAVFANDADNLNQKYAVTKERAVIPLGQGELADFILQCMNDQYYHTVVKTSGTEHLDLHQGSDQFRKYQEAIAKAKKLMERFKNKFPVRQGGYVFGTVAVRHGSYSWFVTTTRGKKELEDFGLVLGVNHDDRKNWTSTYTVLADKKVTLNAPLLDQIFQIYPDVEAIVHYHELDSGLPLLRWAPPGTERDSVRVLMRSHPSDYGRGFEIEHHGVYRLFRKEDL